MRIGFIWQGLKGRYGVWDDGLRAAMRVIESEHTVKYFDFPLTGIHEFNPDVVLYWEAPCTLKGADSANYQSVLDLPYKKALLFAGGPVEFQTCHGFDMFFVESRINEQEFEDLGLPWERAFGVNTQVMRPSTLGKEYKGFMQATFADWKRHTLFADALGRDGAVAGRKQEHDLNGYNRCVEQGVTIFPEQSSHAIATLINQSDFVVNTSSYWGGGQRCTLEAMSCNVPVIVMNDSPKNMEYVEESGAGLIVEPSVGAIRDALTKKVKGGRGYIESKYTEKHYAAAIMTGIMEVL